MAGPLPCLTREQVRYVDQYAMESLEIPGMVLMEKTVFCSGCGSVLYTPELG